MDIQATFNYFENQAVEVERSPIEENLAAILHDGLTSRQHTLDGQHRRRQREEGTPERYVEYRSGDELITFQKLCRENPKKARWLINNAHAKAMGLMAIASEQTSVLLNVDNS